MKTDKPKRSERRHVRVGLTREVIVRDKSAVEKGRSINISFGGMFVRVANPSAVYSEIEVEFSLLPNQIIRTKATVIRVSNHTGEEFPYGLGVCFLNLGNEAKEEIDEYVRKTTRVLKALYFELNKLEADNQKVEALLAQSPIQHRYSNEVLKNIVASELANLRLRPGD